MLRILTSTTVFLFLLLSCKQKATIAQNKDSPIVTIPININYSPISNDEKQHWESIIQSFYDNFLSKKLNGQILIAKNGQILFEKYVGKEWYGRDSSRPMNEHSSLHLASSSKPFTASAILLLQQQGKLNINDSVVKYLPTFPYPNITIKMLLNHRSGLLNYLHNLANWGWKTTQMISNEELLGLLASNKPVLNFPSDTKFSYSNTNYALLALIIEKVSGKSFKEFMYRNIFGPLQMNDTYVFEPKDTATAIPSFYANGRIYPYENLDRTYGDKNIYSTVRDMYKWDQALYTDKILSEETKQMAYQGYSNEKAGMKNYGYGWRMFDFPNQKKIILHNGWWHCNRNAFIRLIQDSATIICLGNNNNYGNYSVMQLSYLFGDYPFEYEVEEGKDTAKMSEQILLQQLKLRADSLKNLKKIPLPITTKKDTVLKKIDSAKAKLEKELQLKKDSLKKLQNE
jgi:CubicO group peptidase (beta-lactamase class C family)